jgi:Flp pilus assembly protein TadG
MRAKDGQRTRGDQSGQSMVEFALVAMTFFILIFGLIDFGRAIFEYNLLASSAREGARAAIMQSNTDSDVIDRTVAASAGMLSPDDVTISGSRTCTAIPCPSVTITVRHSFSPVTPLIGTAIGDSIAMTASSTMVVEK